MKKALTAAFIAALTVISCVSMSGCDLLSQLFGNSGEMAESFKGVVSEQDYEDEESAAQAFLEAEVNGSTVSATFIAYEKESDLSESEIAALNLDFEVDSAEVGYVSYDDGTAVSGNTPVKAALAVNSYTNYKRQKLYIFKTNGAFKYFVPTIATGENLTASYYSDVLNYDRYRNSTVTGNLKQYVSVNGYTQSTEMSFTYKFNGSVSTVEITIDDETTGFYMVATTSGLVAVVEDNRSQYEVLDLIYLGLGDIEYPSDLIWSGVVPYADHTYFEKTVDGFMMRTDKYADFAYKALESIYGQDALYMDIINNIEYDEIGLNFTVQDDNIIKATQELSISIQYQGQYADAASSADYNISDFGKTTVTLPSAARNAVIGAGYTISD